MELELRLGTTALGHWATRASARRVRHFGRGHAKPGAWDRRRYRYQSPPVPRVRAPSAPARKTLSGASPISRSLFVTYERVDSTFFARPYPVFVPAENQALFFRFCTELLAIKSGSSSQGEL
jgi:hypothetical protein